MGGKGKAHSEKSMKLVQMTIKKEYLWCARSVMFLAATPFLWDIYQAYMTGVVQDGRTVTTYKDGGLFFLIVIKKMAFALLFIWFSTGGIVAEKENINKDDDAED